MAHLGEQEYLNRKIIDVFFEALAGKIEAAGIGKHRILVVGGAAMALKYQDGRSTVDIDICFREQNNLYACCMQVAREYNLPEDWINADVMHSDSFSYRLFDRAEYYKSFRNFLEVYVASDLDLYCMKIVAFRPKDIQDMVVLADTLRNNRVSMDDIIACFNRLYGSEYHLRDDDRKIGFIEMQLRA